MQEQSCVVRCSTPVTNIEELDKSSDIEQQTPFGDRKWSNSLLSMRKGGGWLQNQREHHIILTKYEAVHPTAVTEKYPWKIMASIK